jgi:hypothetical protein
MDKFDFNQGNALGVFQLGRARGPALISGATASQRAALNAAESAGGSKRTEGSLGILRRVRLWTKRTSRRAVAMSANDPTRTWCHCRSFQASKVLEESAMRLARS